MNVEVIWIPPPEREVQFPKICLVCDQPVMQLLFNCIIWNQTWRSLYHRWNLSILCLVFISRRFSPNCNHLVRNFRIWCGYRLCVLPCFLNPFFSSPFNQESFLQSFDSLLSFSELRDKLVTFFNGGPNAWILSDTVIVFYFSSHSYCYYISILRTL